MRKECSFENFKVDESNRLAAGQSTNRNTTTRTTTRTTGRTSPRTGDERNVTLWVVLLAVSMGGFGCAWSSLRKE